MPEKKTTIVAEVGDRVTVRNYRWKSQQWEPGTVRGVKTSWHQQRHHNTYNVILDRPSRNHTLWLYVGDDGLRRVENVENES